MNKTIAVARGRVWTGIEAKRVGLVDELGGLTLAIDYAKAAAGIETTASITAQAHSRTEGPDRQADRPLLGNSSESEEQVALRRTLRGVAEIGRTLGSLGFTADRGALTMPPARLRY